MYLQAQTELQTQERHIPFKLCFDLRQLLFSTPRKITFWERKCDIVRERAGVSHVMMLRARTLIFYLVSAAPVCNTTSGMPAGYVRVTLEMDNPAPQLPLHR